MSAPATKESPGRPSRDLYRHLVENVRETIFTVDAERRIRYVNPQFTAYFGYDSGEILGEEFLRIVHPGMRGLIAERHRRRVAALGVGDRLDVHFLRKDGQDCWGDVTVNTIYENNRMQAVQVFIRDITAQKRAEEETRQWKARSEAAIRASGHMLYVYDPDANAARFAANCRRVLGYSKAELEGKVRSVYDWAEEIHPDDRRAFLDCVERCLENRTSLDLIYRAKKSDGSYIIVHDRNKYFPPSAETGERFIGTLADITARVEAQEELKRSQDRLRGLATYLQDVREKERAKIAREVHDELGTILSALKMDLGLFAEELGPGREGSLERVEAMKSKVDQTIADVRKIATALRPGVLDDLGLAAAIEWETQNFERQQGVVCRFTCRPKDPAIDRERATALFRIFQETLKNAARYSGADTIEVRLERAEELILLEVIDNGCGIAEEKIFHPRSLGLMGMRERALLWNGILDIRRLEEGGTKVTATLPLTRPRESAHD